ncbi:MAG: glycosyltransferase [Anaerolineae bacterium]|nr:glycosyltransferase [Gloeobacterales cyanobacterium ES-bin-313]
MNKMTTTAYKVENLPPPPQGRTGWPWTEGSTVIENDGNLPRISVVTPSYNQVAYLEETIRSVLLQGYPNLEYLVIDGGSNDGSVEIIKKYADYLTYWVSEKDRGQSDALNKGFRRATGDFVGWQNSDDCYSKDAFSQLLKASQQFPDIDIFYGSTQHIDAQSNLIEPYPVGEFDIHHLIPHINMCNQAMFFRGKIFQTGQFIDESYQHAMDQEFLLRLALEKYQFKFVPGIQGTYRIHGASKMVYQQEICAREIGQIYRWLHRDSRSPESLKQRAISVYQGLCRYQFGTYQLPLFAESYAELKQLDALTPGLVARYALFQLGPDSVKAATKFKRLIRGEKR